MTYEEIIMAIPIRSIPPLRPQDIARFWARVDRRGPDECWLWTGTKTMRGRGLFSLRAFSPFVAARVAWLIAHGPIPLGLCVCHHCDNPRCTNPSHLFVGTQADNMADAVRKGRIRKGEYSFVHIHPERMARGERHGHARLKEDDVICIREAYAGGSSQYVLARRFGVSRTNIERIIHSETWRHLPPTPRRKCLPPHAKKPQ